MAETVAVASLDDDQSRLNSPEQFLAGGGLAAVVRRHQQIALERRAAGHKLAFLRRFAVINVPLPPEPDYRKLFHERTAQLPEGPRQQIVEAAMKIAFADVQLGPAILRDIAAFTKRGLNQASTGVAPYEDPIAAFLTAVRLYAVPQYEGASAAQVDSFLGRLKGALPAQPDSITPGSAVPIRIRREPRSNTPRRCPNFQR